MSYLVEVDPSWAKWQAPAQSSEVSGHAHKDQSPTTHPSRAKAGLASPPPTFLSSSQKQAGSASVRSVGQRPNSSLPARPARDVPPPTFSASMSDRSRLSSRIQPRNHQPNGPISSFAPPQSRSGVAQEARAISPSQRRDGGYGQLAKPAKRNNSPSVHSPRGEPAAVSVLYSAVKTPAVEFHPRPPSFDAGPADLAQAAASVSVAGSTSDRRPTVNMPRKPADLRDSGFSPISAPAGPTATPLEALRAENKEEKEAALPLRLGDVRTSPSHVSSIHHQSGRAQGGRSPTATVRLPSSRSTSPETEIHAQKSQKQASVNGISTDEVVSASSIEVSQSAIPQAGEAAARPPPPVSRAFTSQETKLIPKAIRSPKSPPTQDGWNNLLQSSWRSLTGSGPSDSKAPLSVKQISSAPLVATVNGSTASKGSHTGSIPKESPLSLVPSSVSNKASSDQSQHASQLYAILNSGTSRGEAKEVTELVHHLPDYLTEEQRDALDGFLMKLVKKPVHADVTTRGVLEGSAGVFSVTLRGKGCQAFETEMEAWLGKFKPTTPALEEVQLESDVAGVASDQQSLADPVDSPFDPFEDSVEDVDANADKQERADPQESVVRAQDRQEEPRQRVHTREALLQLSPQYRKEPLSFRSSRSREAGESHGLPEEAPASTPNLVEAGAVGNGALQLDHSAQNIVPKPSGWSQLQEETSRSTSMAAQEAPQGSEMETAPIAGCNVGEQDQPVSTQPEGELDRDGLSTLPQSSSSTGQPSGWYTTEVDIGPSDNAEGWGQMNLETSATAAKGTNSDEAKHPEVSPVPQEDGRSHRLTPTQLMAIATPTNAFRWHLVDGGARSRLIGHKCRNLNMIAEAAGVVGICLSCKANERGFIYVVGSRSQQLDIEARQSLYLAARTIGAVLALCGASQVGPRSSDLKGVLSPEQLANLPTMQDRNLVAKFRATVFARGQPYRTTDEDLENLAQAIRSEALASQTQRQDVRITETERSEDPPPVRETTPTSSAQPGYRNASASTHGVTMQDDADLGSYRYNIWAERCNETNSFRWSMQKGRARIALFGPGSSNLLYLCGLLGVRIFTLDFDNSGTKRMTVMASDGPVPVGTEGRKLFIAAKVIQAICFLTEEIQAGPQLTDLPGYVHREHSRFLVQTTEEKSILAAIEHHFRRSILPSLKSLDQAFRDLVQLYRGYSEWPTTESQPLSSLPRAMSADTPLTVSWTIPQGIVRDRIFGLNGKNLNMLASLCGIQDAWLGNTPVNPLGQSDETPIHLKASDAINPTADDVVSLRKAVKAVSAICTLFGRADLVPNVGELPAQLEFKHGSILSDSEVSLVMEWQEIIGSRSGGLASNTDQDLEAVIRQLVGIPQNDVRSKAQHPLERSGSEEPHISRAINAHSVYTISPRQNSNAKNTGVASWNGVKHTCRAILSHFDDIYALGAEDDELFQLIASVYESASRFIIGPGDSMSQVIGPEDDGSDNKTISESREAQARGPKSEWQLAFEATEMDEARGARTQQWTRQRQDTGQPVLPRTKESSAPQRSIRGRATLLNDIVQLPFPLFVTTSTTLWTTIAGSERENLAAIEARTGATIRETLKGDGRQCQIDIAISAFDETSLNQAFKELVNVVKSVLPHWDMGRVAKAHLASIEAIDETVLATAKPDEQLWATNMVIYAPSSAMEAILHINWRVLAILVRQDATEMDKLSVIAPSVNQMEDAILAIRDVVRKFEPRWTGDGDVAKAIERLDRADAAQGAAELHAHYQQHQKPRMQRWPY